MRKIAPAVIAALAVVAASTVAAAQTADTAKKPAPPATQMPDKPTPPPELLAAAKAMKGTLTCKGDMMGPDGNSAYKTKLTFKSKLDLGNMWIKTDAAEAKSKATKYPFKFTAYTTYGADGKWHRYMVDNWGGIGVGVSSGPDAAGKQTWELDMNGMMGPSKFRDHMEPGEKKKTIHSWGEMSADGGKTWVKVYDTICTK
jgi:hypothetical protein